MKKILFYLAACVAVGLASCDDDAIFKQELYKKVIALISTGDYNIFQEVHELTGNETIGYIAASCGGTTATESDVLITLEEDEEQLQTYNRAIYDADEDRYARFLPRDKYTIERYQIRIPAGERSGKTMIKVNGEGLSPDSIYFVSLRISDFSAFEANEKKSSLLYQVVIKNEYAAQSTDLSQLWAGSIYSMTGLRNSVPILYSKQLQPLSRNKVRLMAGTEAFQPDTIVINRASIVLEVNEDNSLNITSYKGVYVSQTDDDPDYPNSYAKETNPLTNKQYNVFRLCYEYRIAGGALIQMKEELRMEVK
jgi:hypothetical protein